MTSVFLEDIVASLTSWVVQFKIPVYDQTILDSFAKQIDLGQGLTEKQEKLAIRLLQRYKNEIKVYNMIDIDSLLPIITKRYPTRIIVHERSVKIIEDLENYIQVKFPFDSIMIENIRSYRSSSKDNRISWDSDQKSWNFPIMEPHLLWIKNNILDDRFDICEKMKNLFDQMDYIEKNIENYVPMLVKNVEFYEFKNVSEKIPPIKETDLLPALLEARKYGIFTWDDEVERDLLSSVSITEHLKLFLKNKNTNTLPEDGRINFDIIKDFVFNLNPLLVVIPGGSELRYLESFYETAKKYQIKNSEMTVLFRLSNNENKECNDFIKNNNLNNEISEKIKIFFISAKLPKPLIKERTYFRAVLCPCLGGVNFVLANFIKNHQFVINCSLVGE